MTERMVQVPMSIAPLPDDARMDAYYYGFERTGVGFIDAILSAVAMAGKGSHHTQSWGEEDEYGYYRGRPGLPDADSAVGLIQAAAQQAADAVRALLSQPVPTADEPPRIEDMAPGTKFTEEVRWTITGTLSTGMTVAHSAAGEMRFADRFDPSTIRDVTPPNESTK